MNPFKGLAMAIAWILGAAVVGILFVLLNILGVYIALGLIIAVVIGGIVKGFWETLNGSPDSQDSQPRPTTDNPKSPPKSAELWGDVGWDDSGDDGE
jgi:uncharacterized membrane protein